MPIYDINGNVIESGGTAEITDNLKYADNSIINVSHNLNDEVYERGHFNPTTGAEVAHSYTFRNKNYIPVEGGRTITTYAEMTSGQVMYTLVYIVEYDANKNIIQCNKIRPYPAYKSQNGLTLQENTAYIRLSENNTNELYDTALARINICYEEYFSLTYFGYEPHYRPRYNPDLRKPKAVAIFGDSYSTYEGWIPDGYEPWYRDSGNNNPENDTSDVSQTWWYRLIKDNGLKLTINSSWTGSTICNTGLTGAESDYSFIKRMVTDFGTGRRADEKPELILIMAGVNDSLSPATVGELQYSDWTEENLKTVLPAVCYMLDYVKRWNPTATVVLIAPYVVKADIKTGMETACEHYGVHYCTTCNLVNNGGNAGGHPNQTGHLLLKKDVEAFLRKNDII